MLAMWINAACKRSAAGCVPMHETLTQLFANEFQPKAFGNCGSELYSDMLIWVLLSASPTCRI